MSKGHLVQPDGTINTGKAKHTPAPWKHHLGRGSSPRFHVQTSAGYQIASTTELNQSKEENEMREANARLIAAAPELLEIAIKIFEDIERGHIDANNGIVINSYHWHKLNSAIQKAQG
jgi:hypothetical protein